MKILAKLFYVLDLIICRYLGLKNEHSRPVAVELIDSEIVIINNEPFRRHSRNVRWDIYLLSGFPKTSAIDKQKLGIAVGKALATNLIISFDETTITDVKR